MKIMNQRRAGKVGKLCSYPWSRVQRYFKFEIPKLIIYFYQPLHTVIVSILIAGVMV